MYKTIIIDDEKDHRDYLRSSLETNFPEFKIEGTGSNVKEGMELIRKTAPDLVFLDVMLPPLTGFDLLTQYGEINFEIIFATSFDKFAMQALKLSAVDYLLKPFSISDLEQSIDRFIARYESRSKLSHLELLINNIKNNTNEKMRVALPTRSGFEFIQLMDITRCKSDDVYTEFFFTNRKPLLITRTMKDCESLLSDLGFCRVHTSHLVNLKHIKEYIKGEGGQIIMQDGSVVDVSRRRKEEFLSRVSRI